MGFVIVAVVLVLLLWIAVADLRHRRITNLSVVLLAVLYFIHAFATGQTASIMAHLFVAAVVFVAMLLPYRLRWLGAGDVKMLSAAFLWAGVEWAFAFSVILALATAILAGCVALGLMPTVGDGRRRKVALGPAIAGAMAAMLAMQAFPLPGLR